MGGIVECAPSSSIVGRLHRLYRSQVTHRSTNTLATISIAPFRIAQSQEANFYDTYNHMSQLAGCKQAASQQQSVDDWLDSIKMSKYKENFRINQINTLQSVARLNQVNLNLIGVSNGSHLRKLLNAIGSLRSSASIGASGEGYLV